MAEVTIYTRQLCGYCSAAKHILNKKGASIVEHDATFDPVLRRQMASRSNGASTFPQIFVGDIHVGGCDELIELDRGGHLENLLRG